MCDKVDYMTYGFRTFSPPGFANIYFTAGSANKPYICLYLEEGVNIFFKNIYVVTLWIYRDLGSFIRS